MSEVQKRKQQAKVLRVFRKVHRMTGALLFAFFFVVAITGLLLGWKKHSGDVLLAKSRSGVSTNPSEWLSVDSLYRNAYRIALTLNNGNAPTIDRIDFRPDKGMVKFVFVEKYIGLQMDCTTGELLHSETRRSDFVEQLHDGSAVDRWLGIGGGTFKLVYTTVMGLALLLFTITGFWLWYGPKRMRHHAHH